MKGMGRECSTRQYDSGLATLWLGPEEAQMMGAVNLV